MSEQSRLLKLTCPRCGDESLCAAGDAVLRLGQLGMLRRDARPEWEMVRELMQSSAARLTCPSCGQTGMIVDDAADEESESWGEGRACEHCGQPIPAERLEVFPETTVCAVCKAGGESGELDQEEPQYCPRCGALMQVRLSRGAGISRYVIKCTECRG